MRFSQRKGFKPIKSVLQVDGVDMDLRNSLWNTIDAGFWKCFGSYYDHSGSTADEVRALVRGMWADYFKAPTDLLSPKWSEVYLGLRKHYFSCEWYEVYDFIEYIAENFNFEYEFSHLNPKFVSYCNSILEREMSAYRLVGKKITQITDEEEIAEIEEALKLNHLAPIKVHLKSALDLMTNRMSPNYRNSIKESISAVEALGIKISNNPKASLGDALKEIDKKTKLHRALKQAFSSLYGYTSDAEGIRHALLDESNLNFEDAKFMLVACSAFINYLVVKADQSGITFK